MGWVAKEGTRAVCSSGSSLEEQSRATTSPVLPQPCSVWQEHWGEPKRNGTWQGCQELILPLRGPSSSCHAR